MDYKAPSMPEQTRIGEALRRENALRVIQIGLSAASPSNHEQGGSHESLIIA